MKAVDIMQWMSCAYRLKYLTANSMLSFVNVTLT